MVAHVRDGMGSIREILGNQGRDAAVSKDALTPWPIFF